MVLGMFQDPPDSIIGFFYTQIDSYRSNLCVAVISECVFKHAS